MKNPISIEELSELELSAEDTAGAELVEFVRGDLTDRERWEEKIELMHRKRYGIRRAKSFPWVGASNLNIPMTDKTIRRLKPGFVNLVMTPNPIASFLPIGGEDIQKARDAERFFNWYIKTHIDNFFKSIVHTVDWMLERGFAVIKTTWEYEEREITETFRYDEINQAIKETIKTGFVLDPQSGQPAIDPNTQQPMQVTENAMLLFLADQLSLDPDEDDEFDLLKDILKDFRKEKDHTCTRIKTLKNKPKITAIKPQDVIVPADTANIETARRVVHSMWLSQDDLKAKEAAGIYKNVDDALPATRRDLQNQLVTSQEDREGVRGNDREEELVEVWEIYSWQRINGENNPAVRTVMTVDPESMAVFRHQKFPFEHEEWPFSKISFEENDDRFYSSRGIPEMLDDISTEINAQHNAKIDRMMMANAPMLVIRTGANISGKNINYIPGQVIRTPRPADDIVPFQLPNVDLSFEREEVIMKSWGEEYVGDPSFGLSGPNASTSDPRSATEVSAIEQSSNMIFSLDGRIFQEGIRKVYQQVWALENQYGDKKVYIAVMGKGPEMMTMSEIRGMFDIVPTGTAETTNPAVEANKAFLRLQSLQGNPLIRQRELLADFLEKDDPVVAMRLLKTPEEIEEEQKQAQQQAEEAKAQRQNPTIDQALDAAEAAKEQGATGIQV